MDVSVPFTLHDLENDFSMVTINKGKQIVDQHCVHSLKIDKIQNRILIFAQVQESRRFYKVRVVFDNEKTPQSFENSCDCHKHTGCEHVAATLIASIDPPNTAGLTSIGYKPNDQLKKWLTDLTKPSGTSSGTTSGVTSATNNDTVALALQSVLAVVIHDDYDGGIKLTFHRIPLTAKGVYSKTRRQEFSIGDIFTDSRLTFSPQEWSLLLKVGQYFPKKSGSIAFSRGTTFPEDVLKEIIETGHCYWREVEGTPLSWGDAIAGKLSWQLDDSGNQELSCQADKPVDTIILSIPSIYMRQREGIIGLITTGVPDKLLQSVLKAPSISPRDASYIRDTVDADSLRLPIPKPVSVETVTIQRTSPKPKLVVSSRYSQYYKDKQLTAQLSFLYQGVEVPYKRHYSAEIQKSYQGKLYKIVRDVKTEEACDWHMRGKLDWNADHHTSGGYFLPAYSDAAVEEVALDFHDSTAPDLRAKGWIVEFDHDFPYLPVENVGEWYANIESASGVDWFDLDMGVMIGDQKLNILPLIVKLLRQGFKETIDRLSKEDEESVIHVKLDNGRTLPLPARRLKVITDTLLELYDTAPLTDDGTLRLSKWQVAAVAELAAATIATELRWIGPDDMRHMAKRLTQLEKLKDVIPPKTLLCTLRHYQQEGLNWLQFLRESNFSGILADDMGLGKTIQTLAHILIEHQAGRLAKPVLIVAPTSLMTNWRLEMEKFSPSLKLLVLQGAQRKSSFNEIQNHDVILTTYPLLGRDKDILLAHDYYMLILDEAQVIKNPSTLAYKIIQQIKSQHRLCLTGTPMENHLGELWALFNFILPGFLGDTKRFIQIFRNPIEKQDDKERRNLLAKRVRPFMLRRTKQEVATELPPKTDIVQSIEFGEEQQALYESIRIAMHQKVQEEVQNKGLKRSHIIILDALLKLRQVCCDPRLLKIPSSKTVKESAKLAVLMEMLKEMIEENRQILLFSQFTSMLALIEDELKKEKIDYVILTGSTVDRMTPIQSFQSGKVPLFLISLKAGGTGLNLTAADTVIHYDPWWNPAVENQATDRAHRIGQDKPVFVYKLVMTGTIEEKILQLQQKKAGLLASLFDEAALEKISFTEEDIASLFVPMTEVNSIK